MFLTLLVTALLLPGLLPGQSGNSAGAGRTMRAATIPEGQVVDLAGCIVRGLENNFNVLVSRNNQAVSENNLTPGNAGYLPEIAFTNRFGEPLILPTSRWPMVGKPPPKGSITPPMPRE